MPLAHATKPARPALGAEPDPVPSLSVVIVTTNEREGIAKTVPAVVGELRERDELIVVDNQSTDGTRELVSRLAPRARVLTKLNEGFPAACNAGAEVAKGDLLLLLNPDAVVQPGFRDAIERPVRERRGWAAWMGYLTSDEGRTVNTSGGIVHFTGLAWAGEIGTPADRLSQQPREVGFVSGGCLAVPLATWRRLGGFPPEFFLYEEDVDLSLRLRLEGGRIGVEPTARADHAYQFSKNRRKWRWLERNRVAMVMRCYPRPLLVLIAPALIATELALLPIAAAQGWLDQKLLALGDVARALPRLLAERREVQRHRRVSALEFSHWLTSDLSSPYFGSVAEMPAIRGLLRGYWGAVVGLLRLLRL